jgi:hypothetical protein
MAVDYSLWLFLDLENYGDGKMAKSLDKAVRKTPEFKGKNKHRLYFEFENKVDKMNFIYTIMMELKRQDYNFLFTTETDPNTPKTTSNESIKTRISQSYRGKNQSRSRR